MAILLTHIIFKEDLRETVGGRQREALPLRAYNPFQGIEQEGHTDW